MTEQEWAHCSDPQAMLNVLCGKARDRQLRLFALHCCLRITPLVVSRWKSFPEQLGQALEISEQDADGLADPKASYSVYVQMDPTLQEISTANPRAAFRAAVKAVQTLFSWQHNASLKVGGVSLEEVIRIRNSPALVWDIEAVCNIARTIVEAVKCDADKDHKAARDAERCRQARLIREHFSNPFRPRPAINPAWLSWHDGWIRKQAEAAYAEGRFDTMPVLADALEEAGCGDEHLLGHLRDPEPHWRGCWAVDFILGKS